MYLSRASELRLPRAPALRLSASLNTHFCIAGEKQTPSDTSRDKLLENVDPVVGYVLGGAHGFGAGKTPLLDNGGVRCTTNVRFFFEHNQYALKYHYYLRIYPHHAC